MLRPGVTVHVAYVPVTLAEKIRAYCYGIEKNGDHFKIRKNQRFTNFRQKWHTYPYVIVLIST